MTSLAMSVGVLKAHSKILSQLLGTQLSKASITRLHGRDQLVCASRSIRDSTTPKKLAATHAEILGEGRTLAVPERDVDVGCAQTAETGGPAARMQVDQEGGTTEYGGERGSRGHNNDDFRPHAATNATPLPGMGKGRAAMSTPDDRSFEEDVLVSQSIEQEAM